MHAFVYQEGLDPVITYTGSCTTVQRARRVVVSFRVVEGLGVSPQ